MTSRELLALQLVAVGYSPDQVARLRGEERAAVLGELQRALSVLGTPTVSETVAVARRRGLIV